jgi:hypothetical protein
LFGFLNFGHCDFFGIWDWLFEILGLVLTPTTAYPQVGLSMSISFVGFRSTTQPTGQPFLCYRRNPTKWPKIEPSPKFLIAEHLPTRAVGRRKKEEEGDLETRVPYNILSDKTQ